MTRIVAVTNQKGGVGKTTTAINLASSLAYAGNRVLLVDIDPQTNASVGCGVAVDDLETSVYEVLLGEVNIAQAIIPTKYKFHILPSHGDLSGAQAEMNQLEHRDQRLQRALSGISRMFDIILIDCPPVLNVLTVNALTAATEVLIPVQCEYYALEGLSSLMQTIELVQQKLNPNLKILGLIRTMYDNRNNLATEVSAQLQAHFPEQLFRTLIPRNIRLAEAPSHGKPVLEYDRQCAGSQAYLALASEVLRRSNRTHREHT